MKIRKIEESDIEDVFKLLNALYERMRYESFSKIYMNKINDENSYNVVAIEDDKIIGVLILEISTKLHRAKKAAFIDSLIIDENCRNKGYGKRLLDEAIKYAKEQDCEVIELTSFIANEDGHRFYEKNGFKKHAYKFKQYLNTY